MAACLKKDGTKFNWTIKNFRFLRGNHLRSSNFTAEQLCNSQWQVELYFDQRERTHLQGCLKQTTSYFENFQELLVIISAVDNRGTNTTVFNKLFKYFVLCPQSQFHFACDIADGESYPYDSFQLYLDLVLINEQSINPIEYVCQTIIGRETFQGAFRLSSYELQSSPREIFVYYPVDADLPHLKFRALVTQHDNVYLEITKNTTLMYEIVVFCKITVLLNGGSVHRVTSDWLKYQAHRSDNVRHIKNILALRDIYRSSHTDSFTLELEVSLCTNSDVSLMEVKSLPESFKKSDFPEHRVGYIECLYESSDESENSDEFIPYFLSASEIRSLENKSNSSPSTSSNYGLDKLFESKLDLHSDMKKNEHTLMNDIWVAYNEEKYSDLKICAGDKSFLVHKTILKVRSPVFATMLESDMVEKKSGIVKIKDAKPETVDSFLNFVYSDKLPTSLDYKSYIELYSMAEKYEVILLKEKCCEILKSKISLLSVCDVLGLADLHGDLILKEAVLEFIKKNSALVVKSEQWKTFMSENVRLAADTMQSIIQCLVKH